MIEVGLRRLLLNLSLVYYQLILESHSLCIPKFREGPDGDDRTREKLSKKSRHFTPTVILDEVSEHF